MLCRTGARAGVGQKFQDVGVETGGNAVNTNAHFGPVTVCFVLLYDLMLQLQIKCIGRLLIFTKHILVAVILAIYFSAHQQIGPQSCGRTGSAHT